MLDPPTVRYCRHVLCATASVDHMTTNAIAAKTTTIERLLILSPFLYVVRAAGRDDRDGHPGIDQGSASVTFP
jgi:hypothetical protein